LASCFPRFLGSIQLLNCFDTLRLVEADDVIAKYHSAKRWPWESARLIMYSLCQSRMSVSWGRVQSHNSHRTGHSIHKPYANSSLNRRLITQWQGLPLCSMESLLQCRCLPQRSSLDNTATVSLLHLYPL
jgi:hypothetical protein